MKVPQHENPAAKTITLIKTYEDYLAALEEAYCLFDAEPDTPEERQLMTLVTLVEAYEEEHYPLD